MVADKVGTELELFVRSAIRGVAVSSIIGVTITVAIGIYVTICIAISAVIAAGKTRCGKQTKH